MEDYELIYLARFRLLKELIFGYVHSTQIEDHFRAKATKLLIRILGVELMQFYDHVWHSKTNSLPIHVPKLQIQSGLTTNCNGWDDANECINYWSKFSRAKNHL